MPLDSIAFPRRRDKPKDPTGPKGQGAFTLLEILLAIFIFALVLSTLYAAYTGTFRNIDETQSRAGVYRMARISLERMAEDLESAYLSPQAKDAESQEQSIQPTGFVAEGTELKGRRAETLSFLSRAHLVFSQEDKESAGAQISYQVREREEEDSFVLYRSDTPAYERGSEEERGGWALCDGLSGVDFKYYDENGDMYESWDSTKGEFKGKLPAMVSILLEFVNRTDPDSPLKFMTGVALPMAKDQYEKGS